MPIKKRELLESLTKAALADFARGYDVAGFSTMSKPDLVDALAGLRTLRLAEVLEQLSRDELKAACAAEGLDTSGREKSVLIERLLGKDAASPAPDLGDTPDADNSKNWLKGEPPADPKLAFQPKRTPSRPRDGDATSGPQPATKSATKSGAGSKSPKRPIEQYEHRDAERLNNPPVGLVTPETDPIAPPPGASAKKTYQYDPHLDPSLQWAGKAERLSFEVPTVSLHVHERIDPKTILEAVKARNGSHEQQRRHDHADTRPRPPDRHDGRDAPVEHSSPERADQAIAHQSVRV